MQVPVGKYLTEARSHRDSEKRTWIVQAMDLGRTAQPYASSSSQKVGGTNLMLAISWHGRPGHAVQYGHRRQQIAGEMGRMRRGEGVG